MFLDKLNNDEQAVFLAVVFYSVAYNEIEEKQEENVCLALNSFGLSVKKVSTDKKELLLEYIYECGIDDDRKFSKLKELYDTTSFIDSFNEEDTFNELIKEPLKDWLEDTLQGGDILAECVSDIAYSGWINDEFKDIFNLPKELKKISDENKKLFFFEIKHFYDSYLSSTEEEMLNQIKYFLKLSDNELKSVEVELENIKALNQKYLDGINELKAQTNEILNKLIKG